MAATNPKTVGLCIFLFLTSALITLSLKSSHHSQQWLPSQRKGSAALSHQVALQAHNVAYATFLASSRSGHTDEESAAMDDTDDGYYLGTRVLAYQMLHSKSAGTNNSIPFLVVCTRNVSKRKRDRLKKYGATIILVEKLQIDWVKAGDAR